MSSAALEREAGVEAVSGNRRPILTLAVICVGIFLAALDQTVIVTVLPKVINDLGIPINNLDQAGWIVTAYLLGYTLALPLLGRIADIFGHRRTYVASMILFIIGSLGCALSGSDVFGVDTGLGWLLGFRVVQAVGGGAVLPIGMAMVRDLFAPRRRSFALGMIGAVAEAGGVLGPFYGVAVVNLLRGSQLNFGVGGLGLAIKDWHWIFLLNIPLSLGAIFLLLRLVPANVKSQAKVDWLGGLLLGGTLLLLTLALSQKTELPPIRLFATELFPWFAGGAILALVLFLVVERVGHDPLLPLRDFTIRGFVSANLVNLLIGAALIVAQLNLALLGNVVFTGVAGHDGAVEGGLLLLHMTAFIPLGAILGGLFSERLTYPVVAVAGLLAVAAGFWLLSGWGAASVYDPVATWLHLGLIGLGFGLLIAPTSASAINSMPRDRAGIAAATVTFARLTGMTLALPLLQAWGLVRLANLNAGLNGQAVVAAFVQIYTEEFRAAAIVAAVAILPAIFLLRRGSEAEKESALCWARRTPARRSSCCGQQT